uniref:DNA-damage-inducible protein J n=1 Tax=Candidatus Kentrum sp. FM TaxID=2126340 RepID=A0A450SDP0_9GAMM|nr:MAG: DNA-damage-inducible protein J [Candidatus Kentron sp. FM]VFJ50741.1 MAG: DNA-damage-inducible protein J [Candidatus Kentron sp. FM]VFK08746.1 MAG: DNA-damage-inducible protein J [Candidatus Kentron sp. FM]
MNTDTVVQARIDQEIETDAARVLAGMGLSISDAIRLLLSRVVSENALPFSLEPNDLTQETLRKSARNEDVYRPSDIDEMFRELGI